MPNKPVFLLQNNYYDQIGRLIQPCLDFCRTHEHVFIDRSLTDKFDPDNLGIDFSSVPGVVIYGSVGWIKRCGDSKLAPWSFYDRETFAATSWVPLFGGNALNGDGEVQSVAEVAREMERGARLHIRPNADDKAFNGAVYDVESWGNMLRIRQEQRQILPSETLECWVSTIKKIEAEYRCWFIDHTLVDVSRYRKNSELSLQRETSDEVLGAAEALGRQHLPIGNVVMDIARTADGFKVIEFNPINSSGWYAASTETILSKWCEMLLKNEKVKK
jgi:hypothetical protein